jgi:hypothetical protein
VALALASPLASGAAPRVLVAPARVAAGLAPLARAHREWLATRMRDAGARAEAPPILAAADPAAAREMAKATGADLVVQADLREGDGSVRVALRAHDASSGDVVAATLAEGALPELGSASEAALRELLPHLGIPASELSDALPPTLDELAAASRALAALDRGELGRAWTRSRAAWP